MGEHAQSDPERKYRIGRQLGIALALLVALGLVLCLCALAAGGIVYVRTRTSELSPVAKAQRVELDAGVVIASVVPDGPAAEAGVQRGDVLLEVNGEVLQDAGDLARRLSSLAPGDEVELTVLHGDDQRKLSATLGDRDGDAYLGLVPCGASSLEREVEVPIEPPGAVIVEIVPDGPADQAGLREGDIIVAVGGQELGAGNDLAAVIAEYEPGDQVTLEFERPGEGSRQVTVELGEHPDKQGAAYLGVRYSSSLGIERPGRQLIPFRELEEFDLDKMPFILPEGGSLQGALVLQVAEGSPASEAGLREGDVITAVDGDPIDGPQALRDAVAEHKPGDRIALTVFRADGEGEREIEVMLGEHPDEEGRAYLGVLTSGFFRMQGGQNLELPEGFDFREGPYRFGMPLDELPFRLEELPFDPKDLPFDLEQLPFNWEELQREFEFQWPPSENGCDGPSCLEDSV